MEVATKAFFTAGEREVLCRVFSYLALHPEAADMVCNAEGFDKSKLDSFALVFVTLAQAANCVHPVWLSMAKPCLSGERVPSPFSVAVLQSFVMQRWCVRVVFLARHCRPSNAKFVCFSLCSVQWVPRLLGPLFARLASSKLKRKRAMKEAELGEAFQALMDALTSDEVRISSAFSSRTCNPFLE